MAHICYLPKGSCSKCKYYQKDEDENRMVCYADHDVTVLEYKDKILEERKMTETQKKILFVAELSDAITKVQPNVVGMEYQVFHNKQLDYTVEMLIINYRGGAYSARNCTGNSCSAIFAEIATKLNSGYYDEQNYYKSILEDEKFERIYK